VYRRIISGYSCSGFAVNPLWFCDTHLAPQILSSLLLAFFRSFAPMINAMIWKCSLRGLDHTLLNTFAKCSKDYILDSLAGRLQSITRRNSLFYLKLNALNGQDSVLTQVGKKPLYITSFKNCCTTTINDLICQRSHEKGIGLLWPGYSQNRTLFRSPVLPTRDVWHFERHKFHLIREKEERLKKLKRLDRSSYYVLTFLAYVGFTAFATF